MKDRKNDFIDEVIRTLVDASNAVKSNDRLTRLEKSQYAHGLAYGARLGGMLTVDEYGDIGQIILDVTHPEDGKAVEINLIGGMVESVFQGESQK